MPPNGALPGARGACTMTSSGSGDGCGRDAVSALAVLEYAVRVRPVVGIRWRPLEGLAHSDVAAHEIPRVAARARQPDSHRRLEHQGVERGLLRRVEAHVPGPVAGVADPLNREERVA